MTNDEEENTERVPLHNKLNDIFGIENVQPASKQVAVIPEKTTEIVAVDNEDDRQVAEDFNDTRDTLRELEYTGKTVLDHFVQIAKDSESPRAMEVLGNFMKTLSDISMSKLDIHEKKKALKTNKNEPAPGSMNIQNANIIVGTTNDILSNRDKK